MNSNIIIRNVYQDSVNNNTTNSYWGLGDFINGCYTLFELSIKYNFILEIYLHNHILGNFIETNSINININKETISFYDRTNIITTINTFIQSGMRTFNILTNGIPTPLNNTNFINFFHTNFKPKPILDNLIRQFMKENKLIPNEYITLQIRTGDKNMNESDLFNFEKYIQMIIESKINKNTKVFFTTDNKFLKQKLSYKYGYTISPEDPIHVGMVTSSLKSAIFTLLDFYVMGKSSRVISISWYMWGSNFSKWCCELNNIPLEVISMNNYE